MDHERVDRWCERGILGLVIAVLVFGPLAMGAVRSWEFLVIQALTVGVIALWLARLWLEPSHRLLWPPICWAVVAFVAYAFVRYLQADIEYVARQEFIRILIYAFLFFATLNLLYHQDSVRIIVQVLVFLAMLISLYAIYQFATESHYVWGFVKPEQYGNRGSGTYICPNHLAGFLEMILPIGLAYVFMGRFNHVTKVFLGYASLVILAGIGVSVSRGGWIATGVALAVFFGVLIRRRGYRLPAIVFLVILVGAGVVFVRNARLSQLRFSQMFTAGKLEDIRFALWRPAIQIWRQNIWLGAGPDHFDYRFSQFRPDDVQGRPERVHNDYLNTLADWGLIGFGLVAGAWTLLFLGIRKTWKLVRRSSNGLTAKKSNKSAFVLGASTSLLAILLHSFVDFNMHVPANAILAVILIALISSHLRFATDRYWLRPNWISCSVITLIGIAGLVYLSHQVLHRAKEQYWLDRASRQETDSAEQMEALIEAVAIDPMNSKTAYEIGEILRSHSWLGKQQDYAALAQEAMLWFDYAQRLNPYDGYSFLRYGMCLDWLGRHDEAEPYYEHADKLDPNGYYMVAHQGWHRIQLGDFIGAKPWFERSFRLQPNRIAESYLEIIKRRLSE